MLEVFTAGTYQFYFKQENFGEIAMQDSTAGNPMLLELAEVAVTDVSVGSLTFTIDNTVSISSTEEKNIIATGSDDASIKLNSAFGGLYSDVVKYDYNASSSYSLTAPVIDFHGAVNIDGTLDPGDFVDVNVRDLIITLNSTDANLGGTDQSGLVIKRGATDDYNIFYDQATTDLIAGSDGSELLVALVDGTKSNNALIRWNGASFEFEPKVTFNPTGGSGNNGEFLIDADLTVNGTMTTVDSEDLQIADNTILLNKGETGAGVTKDKAGIEIDRGTLDNYSILYDEDTVNGGLLKSITGTYEKLVPEVDLTPALNSVIGNTIVWDDTNKRFNFDTGIKFEAALITVSKNSTFTAPATMSSLTVTGNTTLGTTATPTTTTVQGDFNVADGIIKIRNANIVQTDHVTNGENVFFGGGGITVIGAGESASTYRTNEAASSSEILKLISDGNIEMYTNIQSGYPGTKVLTASTTGNVNISSNDFTIGSSGKLSYESSAPSTSGTQILSYDGYFYATRVYNASWNDLAEFFLVEKESPKLENHVYVIDENGKVKISDKYADKKVVGICSDSYAFVMKQEYEKNGVPIALSGTVNVRYSGKIKVGDVVTSYKFGLAKKANLFVKLFKNEAIIGKVMNINEDKKEILVLV